MTVREPNSEFDGLERIRRELHAIDQVSRTRVRRLVDSPQGVEILVDGQSLLSFSSNDYLGLAADPRVVSAAADGLRRYGMGSGASHLITGHFGAHHALEEELAEFAGTERALLFSTGYMANLSVVSALADRHSVVFEDRLNHASLIDAARLSAARVRRYHHSDVKWLQDEIGSIANKKAPRLIVTDAVFSMDGDLARLPDLCRVAGETGSWLLVDDAHGIGVLGQRGRGTFEHFGLDIRAPAILMGTLGKAFGTFGAFVGGDRDLVDYLIQRARPYIYTTALPPAVAEATRESLRIVKAEAWRREVLRERVRQFRQGAQQIGLAIAESETAIQPLILGEDVVAVAVSRSLRDAGILVPAIRPPTVPSGQSRLRISLSALHTVEHVDRLLQVLAVIRK